MQYETVYFSSFFSLISLFHNYNMDVVFLVPLKKEHQPHCELSIFTNYFSFASSIPSMNRNENQNSYALLHWTIEISQIIPLMLGAFVVSLSLSLWGNDDDDEQKTTTNILLHTRDYAVCLRVCQIVLASFSFFLFEHAHTHTPSLCIHSEIKVEAKCQSKNEFFFFFHKQHTLHEPIRLQSNSRMLHTSESEMVNGGPNSRTKCERKMPKNSEKRTTSKETDLWTAQHKHIGNKRFNEFDITLKCGLSEYRLCLCVSTHSHTRTCIGK